jgi:Fe-S-cluster containining protein
MLTGEQTARFLREDGQLLQLVDAAFTDSARRSGPHLVCRPGCTQCCHGAFAISPLDSLRLEVGMNSLRSTDPARAERIELRAREYLREFSPEFPGDPATGLLATDETSQEAFEDFANEAACPALDPETGLCDVYPWRPMTCRVFGPPIRTTQEDLGSDASDLDRTGQPQALAVCELCFTQATPEEILAAEMHIPHQEAETLASEVEAAQPVKGETIVAYALLRPAS